MPEQLPELLEAVNHIIAGQRAVGTLNGGAWIDTLDTDEVLFVVSFGALDNTATNITTKVFEHTSDTGTGTEITAARAAAIQGDGGDNTIQLISVRTGGRAAGTRKRYLRMTISSGGSGNIDVAAVALKKVKTQPASNTPDAKMV